MPSATPARTPTVTTVPSSTPVSKTLVSLAACSSYDRNVVEARVRDMVTTLGGLEDIIEPGATVVIKPNLTAGGDRGLVDGRPPNETYTTHPEVVRAITTLCREAGAGRIVL